MIKMLPALWFLDSTLSLPPELCCSLVPLYEALSRQGFKIQ
jgi:hypothetical protein